MKRTPLNRGKSRPKPRRTEDKPFDGCFFLPFSDFRCVGPMDRCHLIPKQVLAREVGPDAVWDIRTWVFGCRAHHSALDVSRALKIPRAYLPAELVRFAAEHGLEWWLSREYGELRRAA